MTTPPLTIARLTKLNTTTEYRHHGHILPITQFLSKLVLLTMILGLPLQLNGLLMILYWWLKIVMIIVHSAQVLQLMNVHNVRLGIII